MDSGARLSSAQILAREGDPSTLRLEVWVTLMQNKTAIF